MSKAHDPHWRYIAIRIDGAKTSRKGVSQALRRHFGRLDWPQDEIPQLTRLGGGHAIIKVHHHQLAAARAALPTMTSIVEAGAPATIVVTTLSSSGTIKTLTDRLGILRKRD